MSDIEYLDSSTSDAPEVSSDDRDPSNIYHEDILHRDSANAHTIGSITGLTEALKDANRLESGKFGSEDNYWDLTNDTVVLADYAAKNAGITNLGKWTSQLSIIGTMYDHSICVVDTQETAESPQNLPFGNSAHTFLLETHVCKVSDSSYFAVQRAVKKEGSITISATRFSNNRTFVGYGWNLEITRNEYNSLKPSNGSATGSYTTAEWAAGTYSSGLNVTLQKGLYMIWLQFELDSTNITTAAMGAYLQVQLRGCTPIGLGLTGYYDSNSDNAHNRVSRTFSLPVIVSADSTTIYPYLHTNVPNIKYNIKLGWIKLGGA